MNGQAVAASHGLLHGHDDFSFGPRAALACLLATITAQRYTAAKISDRPTVGALISGHCRQHSFYVHCSDTDDLFPIDNHHVSEHRNFPIWTRGINRVNAKTFIAIENFCLRYKLKRIISLTAQCIMCAIVYSASGVHPSLRARR